MANDVPELLAEVESARNRMLARTRDLPPDRAARRPAPDRWSVVDVLEHLVLAEQGGIHMMWSSLEAHARGESPWAGELPDRDAPIEVVATKFMRAKETAPPGATPSWGGPLPFWRASFESGRLLLERLAEDLDAGMLAEPTEPHFLMGPLTFRQRLEFLRWHVDHHLPQVEALVDDADGAAPPPPGGA